MTQLSSVLTESILTSVKKMLGIVEDYEQFDSDIIMHINSVFSILNQLGVGPKNGFIIEDKNSKWNEFIQNEKTLQLVKTYMFMKVKMMFDPPLSSAVIECYKLQISEYEWRLNVEADTDRGEENQNG